MGFQFIDDKGRFLGRTGASWAKILTFYAVYYTFLAGLIYFTVTIYADSLAARPGQGKPKISTRTDQPGASVFPFQTIDASIDQDGELFLNDNKAAAAYNKALSDLALQYDAANAGAQDCRRTDITVNKCRVSNAKKLSDLGIKGKNEKTNEDEYSFQNTIDSKKPLFAITLNKLIGWTPVNTKNLVPNGKNFVKNSVQFDCFEFDPKKGRQEGNFNIDFLGDDYLASEFFPYHAKDKLETESSRQAYNKPMVVAQISEARAGAWAEGSDKKLFRCHVLAENIDRPLLEEEIADESDRSWSTDLTGLKIGYVQFGYSFSGSAEE